MTSSESTIFAEHVVVVAVRHKNYLLLHATLRRLPGWAEITQRIRVTVTGKGNFGVNVG